VDFISFKILLFKETVNDLGISFPFTLFLKKDLYSDSRLDKISVRIEVE
jgi:hypothetical protein